MDLVRKLLMRGEDKKDNTSFRSVSACKHPRSEMPNSNQHGVTLCVKEVACRYLTWGVSLPARGRHSLLSSSSSCSLSAFSFAFSFYFSTDPSSLFSSSFSYLPSSIPLRDKEKGGEGAPAGRGRGGEPRAASGYVQCACARILDYEGSRDTHIEAP